jgi:branched-chain amino acid transport system substrate-binding protein
MKAIRQGLFIAIVVSLMFSMFLSTPAGAAEPAKTLKIGAIGWEGWPMGLELQRGCEIAADVINKKGGINIHGEKYKLEIIPVDSKFTQEGGRSAAERLIYQDKVKFIIGDETGDAWLPLTESNKVFAIVQAPNPDVASPKYKLVFQGSPIPSQYPIFFGWLAKNMPSIKTIVVSMPDNRIGHFTADQVEQFTARLGIKVVGKIFWPPDSTDFSTIATKVRMLKPDAFAQFAGGPVSDSLIFKTVQQSGFKGRLICPSPVPTEFIRRAVPLEQVEGMIGSAYELEQQPMPAVAKEFLDAYLAKYPRDYPEPTGANMLYILVKALEKAGSVDPEKVAAVLHQEGASYESPVGKGIMIKRPDLGNNTYVDTVVGLSIKKIEGGKATILHVMSPEEAYGYTKTSLGWK